MSDSGRDDGLRDAAANRGLKLVRSRVRTPGKGDHGRYGLTDADGRKLLGFGKSGLTATAQEIEDYLHKGALADWKTSLRSAGAGPPARPKKRPAPEAEPRAAPARAPEPEPAHEPEPEPKPPPPLSIRPARPADSEAIADLVTGLGFEAGSDEIAARLAVLKKGRETPFLAEQGEVIGILAWHVTPVLHRPAPVGRITMMVVAYGKRRQSVGRTLVEAACVEMRARGCGLIEVTSQVDLSGAHGFYRRLGFERTSYRFAKPLGEE
ncbi:MAG TPA: GNAT family N-acetyltransferase [Allosphingosinicella sp.]|nr:GNAT family N-acetyltransferase [Allosphingosinicella sp.]